MNIETVRRTEKPEELVCLAARNDYRSEPLSAADGFSEVVGPVEPSDEWLPEDPNDGEVIWAKKRTLLDDLMDRGHWGPFEHPHATLSIEGITRVSMAQITRHRHFTFDVMSLRYVGLEDEEAGERMSIPPEVLSEEAVTREGEHALDPGVADQYRGAYDDAVWHYKELLDKGVPQEEARKVLPMATEVNVVMSGNARAWMHLLNIRGKGNVQGEARRIADGVMEEMKQWMPNAMTKYDEDVLPRKLNP